MRTLLVPALAIFAALTSFVAVADDAAAVSEPQARAMYRIQPGDLLTISVWKEPDLQTDVLVRPDGGMSFPLAGDVAASGRSVEELRLELVRRLERFVPKPVVTVAVRQIGGNRIYVLGNVNRPGEFPFSRPVDVMQALSLAGGTSSFAALNEIVILRRDNGKLKAIRFRYAEVARGRDLAQNIQLESGDTVVVP
jgi:polysaccharide biosynthesis/export protein